MARGEYISDDQLSSMLDTEIRQSGNWTGSEWRETIRQSLDYFLMRQKGDEVDGRSKIQAGDVADVVDSVHAELQPMYNVDTLCVIGAEGPDDEDQSHAETEAINWYWKERLRGAEILDEAIQDGLLSRNGYMKVYFERSAGLPYEQTFEGDEVQVQAELARLAQDGSSVEVTEAEVTQEAQYVEVSPSPYLTYMAAGEQPLETTIVEQSPAYYRVTVKVTPIREEVIAESVAPEDLFVSRDAIGSNMQKCRFVAHRRRMPRQDIKNLVFYGEGGQNYTFYEDDVDNMNEATDWDEDVKTSRRSDNNVYRHSASTPDGRTIDLFECYFRVDRDGDGVVELWKCFTSSTGQILRWADEAGEPVEGACEMVRVRPFASGSPMKLAHRHQGRSLFDKEQHIEDWKRHMIRQMADNLAEANNTQTVYARNIHPEDIEETEIGRAIIADNPAQDVIPFKHNNIVGDSLLGLQYADKMRRERGGTAIDFGRENQPVQVAAHSTERIMSAMEKALGMYARNFANTLIRDTFVLLHEQMKLLPGKVAYKSSNTWAETEPRYWVQRTRISVTMGGSDGDKMRKSAALREVIGIQREDANGGMGILVNHDNMYEARLDFARVSGLDNPQQYWMDPTSPEADQQRQQDAESAQRDQQMAVQQSQALYQTQMQMAAMQEETKRIKTQLEAVDSERDRLNKLIVEMSKLEAQTGEEIPFGLLGEDKGPARVVEPTR